LGAIIDSSVFIAAERGLLSIDDVIRTFGDEQAHISAITAAELLEGVHRADKSRMPGRRASVEAVLSRFPTIAYDLVIARSHAELLAGLRSKGLTVASHDLIIAATALTFQHRVVTRDKRSFPFIPALSVTMV
jgi:tRNA(fMet)-specific endonuclease VapC